MIWFTYTSLPRKTHNIFCNSFKIWIKIICKWYKIWLLIWNNKLPRKPNSLPNRSQPAILPSIKTNQRCQNSTNKTTTYDAWLTQRYKCPTFINIKYTPYLVNHFTQLSVMLAPFFTLAFRDILLFVLAFQK